MNPSRLRLIWLVSLVCLLPLRAAQPDLRELLRDALYTEEVTRDPDKAAQQYEELVARHDAQKTFAASALFRLAEVRRKQDRKDEAIQLYQRLIAEFPNAETETKLARENLAALGGELPEAEGSEVDEETREIARLQKLARTSPDLALNPSELTNAVNNNRPRVLAYLLDAGANVGSAEPLVWAARRGHLEVLKVLLEKSPALSDSEGPKALAGAAMEGHVEIVRTLLAAKVDANWQPDTCAAPPPAGTGGAELLGPPLMMAIHLQNQTMIDLLLDSGADVKLSANGTGFTALHLAAGRTTKDAPALVERLIKLGANVNALSEVLHLTHRVMPVPPGGRAVWKISPLQYAVDREAWDCAKALIRHGADMKAGSLVSFFVDGGIDQKSGEKVRFLLENGADAKQPALLRLLIRQGSEAVPLIKSLLEAGCDPNAVDDSKQPPVVDLFDWNFENRNSGNVYLHSDKRSDQAKLLGLLLKHGLDPNTTYGELVRSATGSPGRSGGNPGSPFLEDAIETKTFPKSLLMMVVEMEKRRKVKNVDMIGMLLDAGAKPASEFPEVFDFVAKGDDSLPIAKALLPFRPKTLNLEATGYFLNWNPQVKRLFLDEVLNPDLAARGGVSLVFTEGGKCRVLIGKNKAIPPVAQLLLTNLKELQDVSRDPSTKSRVPVLTRVRRETDGNVSRTIIDWKGSDELPELASGDVIEAAWGEVFSVPGQQDDSSGWVFSRFLNWHFRKHVSLPVVIEIGGKPREIRLRGDLLSYDPTKHEAPLLSAGHLATLFLPWSSKSDMGPDSILTLRRKDGSEVRMDLSAKGAEDFELMPGDHLILPDPLTAVKEVQDYLRPVSLRIPGIPGGRTYGPFSEVSIAGEPSLTMPTLLQVLTDAYAQPFAGRYWAETNFDDASMPAISEMVGNGFVPIIAPHPDLSRIRILRVDKDGKENALEVDLVRAMKAVSTETPDAEVRKVDVPLLPGDVVELPLRTDQAGQPWEGFSDSEELFFRKALSGKFLIRKVDGIIEPVNMVYHQPDWRETPHGLIPWFPKEGVSTMRFSSFSGASLTDAGLMRDGSRLSIGRIVDPFLRDGDQVDFSKTLSSQPAPLAPTYHQQRPRVVPPPPFPNSN